MFELRPYQKECIQKIKESFEEFNKVLVVLFTSAGKTIIFNDIAKSVIDNGGKVLVLAHRDELLSQAAEKMFRYNGIEHTLIKGDNPVDMTKSLFIASVQSLCKQKRLDMFSDEKIDLIIIDEAHHANNETYNKILTYFEGTSKVLGVTATPGDERKLSSVFETTAFYYDLEAGIKDGWCANIVERVSNVYIDLSHVRTVAGDFVVGELDDEITKQFNSISKYIKNNLQRRKRILIFTPRIVSAEILAEVLKIGGMSAEFVCGVSKNRKEILDKFSAGNINILVNSQLVTEGVDIPEVDCIVNLRPSQSNTFVKQMVGRGLRICDGKQNLLYVDFMWDTKKHIVTPCDFFAKNDSISEGMRDFLVKHANLSYELDELSTYVNVVMCSMFKMEGARRIALKEIFSKSLKSCSTFAFLINDQKILDFEPVYEYQENPPTEKQCSFLEGKCGLSCDGVNFGLASLVIDRIIKRIEKKLCSVKQMFFLSKNGLSDSVPDMSMETASEIMDATSKNYWRVPKSFVEKHGGSKRINSPLVDINSLKIEPFVEGEDMSKDIMF